MDDTPQQSLSSLTISDENETFDIGSVPRSPGRHQLLDEKFHEAHEEDRRLVSKLVELLAEDSAGKFKNGDGLTILDIANDCFKFRLPDSEFESLMESLKRFRRLLHLSVESMPLWDDDIVALVEQAVDRSRGDLGRLQSLAVTRSTDAPRSDNYVDRLKFWKKLESAKRQHRLRVSIGNYLGTDSECDDVT